MVAGVDAIVPVKHIAPMVCATQASVWSWDPDAFGVLQPQAGLPNGVEINLRFPGQPA
jgi:hypothetical protein